MVAEYRTRNPQWDTVFRQLAEPATLYLLDSIAPGIPTRTLVLWGAQDPLFPVSGGRRLAARLPAAEFTVLPDCGHLCLATRPAEVARRYRRFLVERRLRGRHEILLGWRTKDYVDGEVERLGPRENQQGSAMAAAHAPTVIAVQFGAGHSSQITATMPTVSSSNVAQRFTL